MRNATSRGDYIITEIYISICILSIIVKNLDHHIYRLFVISMQRYGLWFLLTRWYRRLFLQGGGTGAYSNRMPTTAAQMMTRIGFNL